MSRVVIIDDCKDIHTLLSVPLANAGHEVSCAFSAVEGLNTLRTSPSDVLLLDVEMPEHDGAWCLAEIRGDPALKKLPVIMISALPIREIVLRLAQLGVDGLILKDANLVKHIVARMASIKGSKPQGAATGSPAQPPIQAPPADHHGVAASKISAPGTRAAGEVTPAAPHAPPPRSRPSPPSPPSRPAPWQRPNG